ncbi:MAG: hypothetical protein ACREOZ_02395 [Gloeomargaritales cyanobacterium]
MTVFFPAKCTSFMQPADMGMIASLKIGYKAIMLRKLLAICDNEQMCKEALQESRKARRGCKGLASADKAHLLDAMEILGDIWNKDGKYAKRESIQRCWRRTGILPERMNVDINNEVGSASLPEKNKQISKEACDELCHLLSTLMSTAAKRNMTVPALKESIAEEEFSTLEDLENIVDNWALIEDSSQCENAEVRQ